MAVNIIDDLGKTVKHLADSAKTTKQTANVQIVNETGRTLLSVAVAHKYSTVFKHHLEWKTISAGETTGTQQVEYNTGDFTTGKDWWSVTWVDDLAHAYVTDPKNLRGFVDVLEKGVQAVVKPLTVVAVAIATNDPEPTSKAVAAATAVTTGLTSALLNSEGTTGLKQHILRSEDKEIPTQIIIRQNEVVFQSKSGSTTAGTITQLAEDPK